MTILILLLVLVLIIIMIGLIMYKVKTQRLYNTDTQQQSTINWIIGIVATIALVLIVFVVLKSNDIIKILKRDGWKSVGFKGSHQQFIHESKPGKVTIVSNGNQEIPFKTVKNIFEQANLSHKDFI